MTRECVENDNGRQPATGWRFDIVKRWYENDAIIAFIDLLGTRTLYKSDLPTKDQAEKILGNLFARFEVKFCECFDTAEIQENFVVHIFGDSILISPRKETVNVVERLAEFLLKYQVDLIVNHSSPSRAMLTEDSFFSFKITGASERSILGSAHTSTSLCGGRGVASANDCLKGLPIGVYVTAGLERDLNTELRARIVPVKHADEYPDLFFIKSREGIEQYLPLETCHLLRERPAARAEEIISCVKVAFQDQDTSGGLARGLGLTHQWDVLRPVLQDEDAFDEKWAPWILAHLGKVNEIIRSGKRREWGS